MQRKRITDCLIIALLLLASLSHALAGEEPQIQGQWQQGGILFGTVEPGSRVLLGDKPVRISPSGKFVFGLDRDAGPTVELSVTPARGKTQQYLYSVAQREYKVQRVEGVDQKHVTPPKEVLERISAEAAAVRSARALDDPRVDFLQAFQWPLVGPITGVYGSQRVYNGVPKSPHYGVDIAAPIGAVVVAPAAGRVTLAENDLYYSGGTLIVDHGHGLSSTFIHLSELVAKKGDTVEQGQAIAKVGATGRATGPHLDWRMNWFGVRVDPELLMADTPMPQQ